MAPYRTTRFYRRTLIPTRLDLIWCTQYVTKHAVYDPFYSAVIFAGLAVVLIFTAVRLSLPQ